MRLVASQPRGCDDKRVFGRRPVPACVADASTPGGDAVFFLVALRADASRRLPDPAQAQRQLQAVSDPRCVYLCLATPDYYYLSLSVSLSLYRGEGNQSPLRTLR